MCVQLSYAATVCDTCMCCKRLILLLTYNVADTFTMIYLISVHKLFQLNTPVTRCAYYEQEKKCQFVTNVSKQPCVDILPVNPKDIFYTTYHARETLSTGLQKSQKRSFVPHSRIFSGISKTRKTILRRFPTM